VLTVGASVVQPRNVLCDSARRGVAETVIVDREVAGPGPFRDDYEASLARGVKDDMAMVTLARKIGAVLLRLW
jgi:hypothetical protein